MVKKGILFEIKKRKVPHPHKGGKYYVDYNKKKSGGEDSRKIYKKAINPPPFPS